MPGPSLRRRPRYARSSDARRPNAFACLVAALLLAVAAPLGGQVRGRVVDGDGGPLGGARVELWAPSTRLAVRITDGSGAFSFDEEETGPATGILVSRIGFAPSNTTISSGQEPVIVVLTAAPVVLDGPVVRARRTRPCPNRDDPEARALWRAVSARYSRPDTGGIAVRLVHAAATGPWTDVGPIDEASLLPSGRARRSSRHDVNPRDGYGFRIAASHHEDFAAWWYRALGSTGAGHFIDASFAIHNSLSIRARTEEVTVVAFCSRNLDRTAVGIEGILHIGPDTTLVSAQWTFHPPRLREEAGGEVTFVPHTGAGGQPWLMPASSLYWRRVSVREDLFFYRWERYGEWIPWTDMNPFDVRIGNR
jgi:hypothetical protein